MSKKIGQIALSAKVSTDPLTLLYTALEGHFNIILLIQYVHSTSTDVEKELDRISKITR